MTFSRWDEPDWYGDKAKYDREASLRRAHRRGFWRGVLLILIMLGASAAIILNNASHTGQTLPTATTNPVHFGPVTTIDPLKQAQDDLTRTAIYALAFTAPTVTPIPQPSATASPSAQPPKPS